MAKPIRDNCNFKSALTSSLNRAYHILSSSARILHFLFGDFRHFIIGDDSRLFEELDKKTAVPLIPDFKEYVLAELQNRSILKQLQVISCNERFDAWLLAMSKDEQNVISAINDGLKSDAITIPGTGGSIITGKDIEAAFADPDIAAMLDSSRKIVGFVA